MQILQALAKFAAIALIVGVLALLAEAIAKNPPCDADKYPECACGAGEVQMMGLCVGPLNYTQGAGTR